MKDPRASHRDALRGRGLDPQASPIEDLAAAFDADPELGRALADALGDRASEESATLLHRIARAAESAKDKELRRVVRRSLYRLAQKGVTGAADVPAESPPAPREPATDAEGFLSPLDPGGDRLLWIVKPRPAGVWHASAVVNEPGGMKEVMLAESTRKGLRALRDDLAKRHGVRMVGVDARYVDWILTEGVERARASGSLSPSVASWPTLRIQLFAAPAAAQPSPVAKRIDAAKVRGDAALLRAAADLFETELRPWFLAPRDFEPYLERIRAMRDSPILIDRQQQSVRLEEIVGAAVREIFGGDGRASWVRRLEEMAYVLVERDRRDDARGLYATALALGESDAGGEGIPFCETLVRRTFSVFFTEQAEREEERKSSSLLVTPDDLREEQRRRR